MNREEQMPKYNIEAQRTTYYYIEDIEADSEEAAEQMVFLENLPQPIENYAVDWDPVEEIEIFELDEEEE
jgi:hypothetical protein